MQSKWAGVLPQPHLDLAGGIALWRPAGPSSGSANSSWKLFIAKHWHFVREKCAAGLVVLKYLETALQVADMFTKQIFPKHFERLRRVMMGHENFDDMQARYVQVKASGDDMDDPKLYVDSKPGRPPK